MTTQEIILTIAGVYNLVFSMVNTTQNWKSAIIYKAIPFFVGLACLYAGWIL
jgi:cytochrome c oxidase assembly factor CtaG